MKTMVEVPAVGQGRVVEIQITDDEYAGLYEAIPTKFISKALGYLGWWGSDWYPHVTISARDVRKAQPELIAVYRQHSSVFVMGAVWRPDRNEFSYHS